MKREPRAVTIGDVSYQIANDVARECGVSRQTLWRWRRDGLIPRGQLYRGRFVVYKADEVASIRAYANRIVDAQQRTAQSENYVQHRQKVSDIHLDAVLKNDNHARNIDKKLTHNVQ